ncbi:MAG: hypothetical protein PHQ40_21520 [Anaerolineaceae bacterium]|nr:hypothetical protein [Anaerolineaceae bacterium]
MFLLGSSIVWTKTNGWPFSISSLSSPKSYNAAQLKTSIPFVSITDWQQFKDADFQITMDYPVGWKVEPTIQQKPPFSDPEAIIKRLSFLGPEGGIDLDIWLSNGQSLQDWLAWYIKSRDALPITQPNAVINAMPAVVFIQNGGVDMLTAFFSDTQYTYRLWYSVNRNGRGLQAF